MTQKTNAINRRRLILGGGTIAGVAAIATVTPKAQANPQQLRPQAASTISSGRFAGKDWMNIMTTNATGTFLSMKYEIPVMLQQGSGVIINNASVSGHVGFATIAPYSASKHAIMSLTKVAALEYADKNIRINSMMLQVAT